MYLILCLFLLTVNIDFISATSDGEILSSEIFERLKKYEDFELYRRDISSSDHKLREEPLQKRLPRIIVPYHYDISLQVYHWGNYSIVGLVTLDMEAKEDTTSVILNSKGLTYSKVEISELEKSDVRFDVTKVVTDDSAQTVEVFVKPPLRKDTHYRMVLSYEGPMGDKEQGLYGYDYVDANKVTRNVAMTQFQAVHARKVFPCLDEPDFKARFTLHLARPANSTAISNTDLVSTAPFLGFEEYEWDNFETTVKMPTYLLAFAITQFKPMTSTHYGVTYRVFMRPERMGYGRFLLKQTPLFIRFFEEFYQIKYPLPKLDSLASTNLRPAGMENWGLITYKESAILVDDSSTVSKQISAAVLISHEVAHQWFGNLVTCEWWSDIWLNEGFATYMSLRGLEAVMPQVHAMDLFVTSHQMLSLALDSTEKSTPIVRANITSVQDISKTFNILTYNKGAALVRMMDHFLTSATFQRGIRNYLLQYQYSNANNDDLWRHLTEVAHKDGVLRPSMTVKSIMDTWTTQPHYPVVTINRHLNGSCTIYQKAFVSEKVNTTKPLDLWWVPVSVLTEGSMTEDTIPTLWLPPNSKEMFLAGLPHHPRWVILNVHQTAYYRVNYDYTSWTCIVRQLQQNHSAIPVVSRAQIIDDAFHLFMENELESPDILFLLMSYLEHEDEYLPWVSTIRAIEVIYGHIRYLPEFFELKAYLQKLIGRIFNSFGVDRYRGEDVRSLLATRIQKLACGLFDTNCEKLLLAKFQLWKQTDELSVVQDTLVTNMLCTGIKHEKEEFWEELWTRVRSDRSLNGRHRILAGLACSEQPWTLKRYAIQTFKYQVELGYAAQLSAVRMISRNPISYDYVWNIIKDTSTFKQRFGISHVPGPILIAAVAKLNEPRHLMELARYFKANPVYTGADIKKVMSKVSDNIKWLNKYHGPVKDWLTDNYPFEDLMIPVKSQASARHSYRSPRNLQIRLIE